MRLAKMLDGSVVMRIEFQGGGELKMRMTQRDLFRARQRAGDDLFRR